MSGFRSTPGPEPKLAGRFAAGGPTSASSPFTQTQVLHLMKSEFARARRYEFPLSCLLILVDRLRELGDVHGGEIRETVRGLLEQMVRDKTRGADHLGVVGEDRYLLVLPHTDEPPALMVAERIREQFSLLEIQAGTTDLSLSLSIGVATSSDHETLFFDTLLQRAELAVEWAIEAGGNQAAVFRQQRFMAHEEPTAGES